MVARPRGSLLAALLLAGGCSIDFDAYYRAPGDAAAVPADVVTPVDRGATPADVPTPPADLGATPDAGTPPADVPTPPTDVPTPPTDVVTLPTDVVTLPMVCAAPYLVAVAENLDNSSARLLRWSFATDARCADLPLNVSHPRAVGVAFDDISALTGPNLIVANDDAVHHVELATGFVIREVAVAGPPRSIFDIVANGSGSFAVAYSDANSSPPGNVGTVKVFEHRGGMLRDVQTWRQNGQYGLSVRWMTGYPANQGQYTQIRPPQTGTGWNAIAAFPVSTGLHELTQPGFITGRNNVVSATFYRSADRRGHYALAMSSADMAPSLYLAESGVSSATQSNVYGRVTNRCEGTVACPAITRAVASPDESDVGAAICELTGTQYTVVRFGGAGAGCLMLDTAALGGRWRINDLAVVPR